MSLPLRAIRTRLVIPAEFGDSEFVLPSVNVSRLEPGLGTLLSQIGAHAYARQETKLPLKRQPGVMRKLRRTTRAHLVLGFTDAEARVSRLESG